VHKFFLLEVKGLRFFIPDLNQFLLFKEKSESFNRYLSIRKSDKIDLCEFELKII